VDDASATPSVNPQIQMAKTPTMREEPLHAELKAFLESVQRRSPPAVTLEDGRRALAVALDVVASIREHAEKIDLERLHA
jgi:predicted dehydrogenase